MKINTNKILELITVLYLVVSMVLPRSYALFKLPLLFLLFFFSILIFVRSKRFCISTNVILFYLFVIFYGITWSIIGFVNGGSLVGIIDNFRLWVIWSIFYFIIVLIFLQRNSLILIHRSVLLSGIFIFCINFLGLLNFYYGLDFLPESLIEELDLKVGFHDGYVQMTTQNIASLFFIIPYLIVIQCRKDSLRFNNIFTKIVFILTLLLAIFSGRRALWLCILLTPLLIVGLSFLQDNLNLIYKRFRKLTYLLIVIGVFSLIFLSQTDFFDIPTITHLKSAFSSEDERTIQKVFLINSFYNYPLFGSGFGVGAGYVRNDEAPWLYELTYHQILFNFGIIGAFFLILFIGFFFIKIFINLKKYKGQNNLFPSSIIIGISSFAIGAYSNPYFGSFDFLLYISMIPYLSALNLNCKLDLSKSI